MPTIHSVFLDLSERSKKEGEIIATGARGSKAAQTRLRKVHLLIEGVSKLVRAVSLGKLSEADASAKYAELSAKYAV